MKCESFHVRFMKVLLVFVSLVSAVLLPRNTLADIQSISVETNAPTSLKIATENLAKVFPSIHWYGSAACLMETTRNGFSPPQKHDQFAMNFKATVEKIFKTGSPGMENYRIRLRLQDPSSPEEYWIYELAYKANRWEVEHGYKYMNGSRESDLFGDEYLGSIKIMGSMKPYIQQLLTSYSEGMDFGAPDKEFDSVIGRWKLDIDYAQELWKAERGTNYNEAEWIKNRNDPEQISCDEVRLDATTISFLNHGKLNVEYPVLSWREEKGVVWINFKHFLGGKGTTGFVRTGERLKLIHSDRSWWLYSAYKKPSVTN